MRVPLVTVDKDLAADRRGFIRWPCGKAEHVAARQLVLRQCDLFTERGPRCRHLLLCLFATKLRGESDRFNRPSA